MTSLWYSHAYLSFWTLLWQYIANHLSTPICIYMCLCLFPTIHRLHNLHISQLNPRVFLLFIMTMATHRHIAFLFTFLSLSIRLSYSTKILTSVKHITMVFNHRQICIPLCISLFPSLSLSLLTVDGGITLKFIGNW